MRDAFRQGGSSSEFHQGAEVANLVLADEINRTPPKTQAALLQSMQEYRVTAGGTTHDLPLPFLVFATQNPIEQEGTYPLPEAHLDRYKFQVDVDYPNDSEEEINVRKQTSDHRPELTRVLSPQRILQLQELVRRVPAADHVVKYAVSLARSTRPTTPNAPAFIRDAVSWGAGPRASKFLILAAKARAILDCSRFGRRDRRCRDARPPDAPASVDPQLPRRSRRPPRRRARRPAVVGRQSLRLR